MRVTEESELVRSDGDGVDAALPEQTNPQQGQGREAPGPASAPETGCKQVSGPSLLPFLLCRDLFLSTSHNNRF